MSSVCLGFPTAIAHEAVASKLARVHGVASAFSIASRNGFASGVTFDSKNSALVPSRLTTYLLKFHLGD